MRIVRALHARFPDVTFDCTVKVEHVLAHEGLLPELRDSGCLFMVSAFESLNDATLERLDKGHTAADAAHAVTLLRTHGIDVRPSFLPFTPWTTRADIVELLEFAYAHDLVGSIDPVQYTIRLLLPEGSLLLDHADLAPFVGPWDPARLTYEWTPADPRMDALQHEFSTLVEASVERGETITETYAQLRDAVGLPPVDLSDTITDRPRLTESWFCCAEPTDTQLKAVTR